jgi:hypothetical protein
MNIDKNSLLNTARMITKEIVESNYSEEVELFDDLWQKFVFKARFGAELCILANVVRLSTTTETPVVKNNALALMTPIIIGTVAEVIFEMRTKNLSVNELERFIGKAASRQGARPSLIACLIRNLPPLCKEISLCKENDDEAVIFKGPVSHYRVWTEGKNMIIDDIEKYEKRKRDYLFWIDLRERSHAYSVNGDRIGPQAIKLLMYLIQNLEVSVAKEDVFKNVFDNRTEVNDTDIDNIQQQITKLHKYCGGEFRQYLFSDQKRGFGLKASFADKYFLFEKLRGEFIF